MIIAVSSYSIGTILFRIRGGTTKSRSAAAHHLCGEKSTGSGELHYYRQYSPARFFCSTRPTSFAKQDEDKPLIKVAIVGGGPAGLCAALQLAPLISSRGCCIVEAPIDVYETESFADKCNNNVSNARNSIGVGIWSTALLPFLHNNSSRPSHQFLLQQLESQGCYIGNVGYRTPNGSWLTQSTLWTGGLSEEEPSLLFLQERALLQALRDAIAMEPHIQIHYGHTVQSIEQQSNNYEAKMTTTTAEGEVQTTTRVYNLILVADGMNSNLRKRYSRHMDSNRGEDEEKSAPLLTIDVEDRGYTVFRGNAAGALTTAATDSSAVEGQHAFQTWGEKGCMRFAVVPCPIRTEVADEASPRLVQGHTWFFTTNDPFYLSKGIPDNDNEQMMSLRKNRLLESIADWHEPITQFIQSTPAKDIIMERAVAHRYSAAALGSKFENTCKLLATFTSHFLFVDVHSIRALENSCSIAILCRRVNFSATESTVASPLVCFLGDADMTVDPVLAQGITISMEDAAIIAKSIERAYKQGSDPFLGALRKELIFQRHPEKVKRLTCLLRATELVQNLAQPSGVFTGFISLSVVRPLMKYVPSSFKKGIFQWVLKYSLGTTNK